jgi:hypothetical protein
MTANAVQFFQGAYTILLGLALGEAFKQFLPDGDENIRWDRLPSLLAFLLMILPFFQGMSSYIYATYSSHPNLDLAAVEEFLLFDGMIFLVMSAIFFVLSRSLSPNHWFRFYIAMLTLIVVDSVWISVSLYRGSSLQFWLVLNIIVAALFASVLTVQAGNELPAKKLPPLTSPPWISVAILAVSTTIDYAWMLRNYFFQTT